MDISLAKRAVIDAGLKLLETGLIARTWGNVSCRISDTQFVITPSGRSYDSLTEDDIVLVNIEDLSYDGDVKPSSEKGIHAQCYALRSDVNFVIHTHQYLASVLSAVGKELDALSSEHSAILGSRIPIAAYGLPGTGKLRAGVEKAIKSNPDSNAVIMSHHGAVCLGKDADNAFLCSKALEDACLDAILKAFKEKTHKKADSFEEVLNHFEIVPWETSLDCFRSVRRDSVMCMTGENGTTVEIDLKTGSTSDGSQAPETASLHRAIYLDREDIGCIIHSKKGALMAASQRLSKILLPCLDDSAQIAGVDTRIARFKADENSIKNALDAAKNRNAFLLADNGALCFSSDEDDADAVMTVLEKNCAATVAGRLFGGVKVIGAIDSNLMRFIYKTKYSKKKDK